NLLEACPAQIGAVLADPGRPGLLLYAMRDRDWPSTGGNEGEVAPAERRQAENAGGDGVRTPKVVEEPAVYSQALELALDLAEGSLGEGDGRYRDRHARRCRMDGIVTARPSRRAATWWP